MTSGKLETPNVSVELMDKLIKLKMSKPKEYLKYIETFAEVQRDLADITIVTLKRMLKVGKDILEQD